MKIVAFAVSLVLLTACSQTPPTEFYTLASRPMPVEATEADDDPAWPRVALAPVTLAAYLDRPQFVLRIDATRMMIADFDSWIEPLDVLVQRTMAANLEQDPRIGQVLKLPQRRPITFDLGIEIQIDQFEANADNTASIRADWVLIDAEERELARSRFSSRTNVPTPADYAERSLALSALLDALAREILDAVP